MAGFRVPRAPKTIGSVSGLVVAAVLLGCDLLIPDPMVFPMRETLCLAIMVAGLGLSFAGLLFRRPRMVALFAASAGLAAWQGLSPAFDRADVLARQDADAIAIERHFVVGYVDGKDLREQIRDAHIGGIFLTRRNVEGLTSEQVAAEVAEFQAIHRAAGDRTALIVTADQEGGPVSHLSPPLPRPLALSEIAKHPTAEQHRAAEDLGAAQGAALKSIGVTMDLAPVVDLTPSRAAAVLDLHTRIATRSISSDPTVVASVASGFSSGMLEAGITPTAKHFPGLGGVATDTHLFGASLDTSEHDLEAADWLPFRAVLGVPGAAVMLAHVALGDIDPGVPASRSRRLVTGLLRDHWGFQGIAITDDLTMGAVVHAGLCRAVEGALNAGIDLLLVSWDTDKVYPAIRCALDALAAGRLDRSMLAASARWLDAMALRTAALDQNRR